MNSNVMSERMSERFSESTVEICRYMESRFGKGLTVSSQLTRFDVKALQGIGFRNRRIFSRCQLEQVPTFEEYLSLLELSQEK